MNFKHLTLRQKEALATQIAFFLLVLVIPICFFAESPEPAPYLIAAIMLPYGLFMALSHRAEMRQNGVDYDERDYLMEAKANRAAFSAGYTALGLYIVVLICADPTLCAIPFAYLVGGFLLQLLIAMAAWSISVLKSSGLRSLFYADCE